MLGLKVIGVGRVVKSPEIRMLSTGTEKAEFTIVYSEKYNGKEVSHFFECEAFGGLTKIIKQYVMKGDKIGIEGLLKQGRWQNKEGKTQQKAKILLQNIELLGQKKESNPYNADIPDGDFFTDGEKKLY